MDSHNSGLMAEETVLAVADDPRCVALLRRVCAARGYRLWVADGDERSRSADVLAIPCFAVVVERGKVSGGRQVSMRSALRMTVRGYTAPTLVRLNPGCTGAGEVRLQRLQRLLQRAQRRYRRRLQRGKRIQ